MSHKRSNPKPAYSQRVAAPIGRMEDGKPILMCPFCKPSHPLIMGGTALCGTDLQVRAIQTVFKAKYEKGMLCAKCGKGGGEMVMFQNAFVHINDCMPGVATLTQPPKFSLIARLLYRFPERIKNALKKKFGEIMPVAEVLPDGTRTGKTLGYFFYKGQV